MAYFYVTNETLTVEERAIFDAVKAADPYYPTKRLYKGFAKARFEAANARGVHPLERGKKARRTPAYIDGAYTHV